MNKTILEKLEKLDIPYAICIEDMQPRNSNLDYVFKDYFLIIWNKDVERCKTLWFKPAFGFENKVYRRDMSVNEIERFNQTRNKYIKTHETNGSVYELITNRFK